MHFHRKSACFVCFVSSDRKSEMCVCSMNRGLEKSFCEGQRSTFHDDYIVIAYHYSTDPWCQLLANLFAEEDGSTFPKGASKSDRAEQV